MRADSPGGVILTERDGRGIARIEPGRGRAAEVAELLRGKFGISLPDTPRFVSNGDVSIGGIAPNTWIAVHATAGNSFAESLQPLLGSCGAVVDQSDAYVILRLTGPKTRETLGKLVPIDIHPRDFEVNDIAQTVCGYMSVTLWRLEDSMHGEPTFEIWVGRSLAVSLEHAIRHSAAEYGFVRQTP